MVTNAQSSAHSAAFICCERRFSLLVVDTLVSTMSSSSLEETVHKLRIQGKLDAGRLLRRLLLKTELAGLMLPLCPQLELCKECLQNRARTLGDCSLLSKGAALQNLQDFVQPVS